MSPRPLMWWAAATLGVALAGLAAAAPAGPRRPAAHAEITVTPEAAHATDADAAAGDLDDDAGLDLLAAEVPPGHGAGHGGPGMGARTRMGPGEAGRGDLRAKLNLTADQKDKLAEVRERQARRAIPIRADLELAALDLHKLMRADRPDQRQLDAQVDKIAGLRASLEKARIAAMLEARALLTPAQQKTLHDARGGMGMPGMMRRMMMGRGMGRGMDGGPMERKVNVRVGP